MALAPQDPKYVVRLYKTGLTLTQVAERVGLSRATVYLLVKKAGASRGHPGNWPGQVVVLPRLAEMLASFDAGVSVHRLAIEHKASQGVIRRILGENGRTPRNRSDAQLQAQARKKAAR